MPLADIGIAIMEDISPAAPPQCAHSSTTASSSQELATKVSVQLLVDDFPIGCAVGSKS